jgi:hypothetical protein
MKRTMVMLCVAGALAGCGGTGSTGTTCEVQKGFCAALTVPQSYSATPVKVIVGLYKSLPATGPSGPPDAVAMQAMNPAISAAMPMEVKPADLTVSGDYYVYAALYNQGGGMFVPVKGIDYTAQTASPVTIGGATSPDLGALVFALAQ